MFCAFVGLSGALPLVETSRDQAVQAYFRKNWLTRFVQRTHRSRKWRIRSVSQMQMLEQYAEGSLPKADVLLTAMLKLDGNLETLKKSVAKVESEIGRSLNKTG